MMLNLLSKNKIIKKYEELEKEIDILKKKNEALEKELYKYKNSNTPSSANKHLKENTLGLKAKYGSKRGAPMGHRGITRRKREDGKPYEIHASECPRCHSKDFEVSGKKKQQIEEYPQEISTEAIDVSRDICHCRNCNFSFLARDGKTPVQGKFGINIMVLIIFLKFIVRGVLRKTTCFLEASFAFKLAPASVKAIIERAASAGAKEYLELQQKIRNARLLYIDETSFSVLGKNWWVWVFRSDTDLLLVIRNSRGNKVLEEILGKNYSGTVICDCWRAYDFLSNATIQRCWAHLLRKSKELDSIAGKHFHKKLHALFDEIIKFNSNEKTAEQRIKKYAQMTKRLQQLTKQYSKHKKCNAVVKYINFHIENWFTCIKIAGIQPTNNFAEQAIRETVLVRKIIGAFRSINGTKTYETLASLIATWQLQKLDIKKELHRMLTTNLC